MVKVAVGHVLRTAMKLVRGEALGRARASAVRDLAEAMAMVVSVVASYVEKVRESLWRCNRSGAGSDWLERQDC